MLTAGMPERISGKVYEGVHLLNRDDICVEAGAKVKPGVVLDAEGGPIFIGKNAKIFPNATIEGPAARGGLPLSPGRSRCRRDPAAFQPPPRRTR